MLEEPTLLNKGAIPFKFVEKEINYNIKHKIINIYNNEDEDEYGDEAEAEAEAEVEVEVEAEGEEGEINNKLIVIQPCCINRLSTSKISIDYNLSQYVNYRKFIPYYMRFANPYYNFVDYNVAINSKSDYGCCLRRQISSAINLELLNLEEIFNVFVPSIYITNPLEIKYKDTIRNQFISFCLNIEKTYLFYNNGKLTCNNLLTPWANLTPFALNTYQTVNSICDRYIVYSNQFLFDPLDQYNIYTLSVNYFQVFNNNNKNINYETIMKIANNEPYIRTNTDTNFFQIINYTYTLMSFLFGTSRKLLLGLETGLSNSFIKTFFPRDRQLYYYNLYNSWIISRIQYKGFGNRINSSNGDDTFVKIPQQQFAGWKTSWN